MCAREPVLLPHAGPTIYGVLQRTFCSVSRSKRYITAPTFATQTCAPLCIAIDRPKQILEPSLVRFSFLFLCFHLPILSAFSSFSCYFLFIFTFSFFNLWIFFKFADFFEIWKKNIGNIFKLHEHILNSQTFSKNKKNYKKNYERNSNL